MPCLITAAANFPQYPIDEASLRTTAGMAYETVRTNYGDQNPTYQLLTSDYSEHYFAESFKSPYQLLAERL